MRYQNWDVLLFPDQFKVPLQEFKTSCQVIQDPESHNLQSNPLLLPTVTSFVPGIGAGAAFRVSIHCWQNPEVSRYIQTLKKPTDTVMFEARLFIDGRLAGSKWFNQHGPWPTIIELSLDLDKHGEFEKLKWPTFHKELLSQSYWNPGDDLGRIKIIISEGFSRELLTYPFERIKNIVSFSFQHAPLEVLEASSIAWPNASMWRQVSLLGPYVPHQVSPRQGSDIEAHSHSPRHGQPSNRPLFSVVPAIGSMPPPLFSKQPTIDPFVETSNPAFTNWRHISKSDTSMPDYSSSNTRTTSSRQFSDPMQYEKTGKYESIQMPGAFESLCEALLPGGGGFPAVPVNTPNNGIADLLNASPGTRHEVARHTSSKMAFDFSLVKPETQPVSTCAPVTEKPASISSSVKSRKENIQDSSLVTTDINPVGNENATRKVSQQFVTISPAQITETGATNKNITRKPGQQSAAPNNSTDTSAPAPAAPSSAIVENSMRRLSQPFTTTNGSNKRQRVVSAAAKAIDDEDEPRSSPSRAASISVRKTSQASVRIDNKENERVILGGIQNV
ncbi:unnamed protein product [Diplocarpon coronariae]|uniref:Uncharacterized protein n=1 Tax=Diplocarpon coronariae TaxID=2795749 RepID=A0A218YZD0_9HELO|nr:hypothetical protein JHW43_002971 [Diplocarpon mali]OWP00794.1 hypothetical protein B2J93_6344 [Marssonina coronariae]